PQEQQRRDRERQRIDIEGARAEPSHQESGSEGTEDLNGAVGRANTRVCIAPPFRRNELWNDRNASWIEDGSEYPSQKNARINRDERGPCFEEERHDGDQ